MTVLKVKGKKYQQTEHAWTIPQNVLPSELAEFKGFLSESQLEKLHIQCRDPDCLL